MRGALPRVVGRVATRITFLAMLAPPPMRAGLPPVPGAAVVRAVRPPVGFYRWLYESVGRDWLWTNRRLMSDEELANIVQDPRVEVHVLWLDGSPAGYAELDRRTHPAIDLAYFGLLPEFIGRGLGAWFLAKVLDIAWAAGPERVTVNTCDLDHPKALATYEAVGFVRHAVDSGIVAVVEGMKLPGHLGGRSIMPPRGSAGGP